MHDLAFKYMMSGGYVYHSDIYDGHEAMIITGIRHNHDKILSVELEGDYSGGTHNVCQRDWLPIDGLIIPEPVYAM